ncbi:hypothetical protein TNCV_2643411 [Trichonephila clavipes]|nr:hypothetical protein TNCV_2643411 [Trichonephila clavipes]
MPMKFIMAKCSVTSVVSRILEHHTGDSTIWLVSIPILRENTSSPSPTSREDLRFDSYLEKPHAVKALYIYHHRCLHRDLKQALRHNSHRR